MPGPKIPDSLRGALWRMSREVNPATCAPWTDQELADWLRAEHGISCSHDAVTRLLKPFRATARGAALEVIRAQITRELATQLDDLDGLATMVAADARDAKPGSRRELFEALTKFVTMKLRYALGERVELDADVALDAKVTVTDARERVAAQLARLAAGAGRSGAG